MIIESDSVLRASE